jgi:hypothetical protein
MGRLCLNALRERAGYRRPTGHRSLKRMSMRDVSSRIVRMDGGRTKAGGHRDVTVEQKRRRARGPVRVPLSRYRYLYLSAPRLDSRLSRSFQAFVAVFESFIPLTHTLTPFHGQFRQNKSTPAHGLCASKADEQWKMVDGGLIRWLRNPKRRSTPAQIDH